MECDYHKIYLGVNVKYFPIGIIFSAFSMHVARIINVLTPLRPTPYACKLASRWSLEEYGVCGFKVRDRSSDCDLLVPRTDPQNPDRHHGKHLELRNDPKKQSVLLRESDSQHLPLAPRRRVCSTLPCLLSSNLL